MDEMTIRRIKDASKIEDVFRHYGFTLKKSGKSYKTKCPFHDDHKPSMTITPSRNICKCFSCGIKAMDPIGFVERYENISFIHALKKLASISGIYVSDETRTEPNLTPMKQKKQYTKPSPRPITELSRKLVTWFEGRGISEPTLKQMRINEGPRYFGQIDQTRNAVQFNFYRNGELVNVKYRDGAKNFSLESGAEIIPYNIDAIADVDTCIITEGEIDCLSFVEIGHTNCISIPNGANSLAFLDDCIEDFEHIETIYIAVDTDAAGIAAREELIRRFGAERCKIVTYGDGCKDANEHLVKYGPESLKRCLDEATVPNISGIYTLDDYETELDLLYAEGLKKGYIIGHDNLDALCSFETKRLCTVTGIPGSGKSEFIDEMCWRMNNIYGFKIGYFSPENAPMSYHASKIIPKLCGKTFRNAAGTFIQPFEYEAAKEYYRENFFHILPKEGYTIDNILEKARILVKTRGIKILVVDPFNRVDNEQESRESETQYISRVLDKLSNFAQRFDLLIFLMVHPTKMRKDGQEKWQIPDPYDMNGSAHFFNKSDFILIVHRDRKKNNVLVRVSKVKFRHLGDCGDAYFYFNCINGRYVPIDGEDGKPSNADYDNTNYVGKKLPVAAARGSVADNVATSEAPSNNEMPFELPSDEKELPF